MLSAVTSGPYHVTRVSFPPDDDALVGFLAFHVGVAVVSDGKDVRRELADLFVPVEFDLFGSVDRQDLVRVHRHQNRAGVRLENGENVIIGRGRPQGGGRGLKKMTSEQESGLQCRWIRTGTTPEVDGVR